MLEVTARNCVLDNPKLSLSASHPMITVTDYGDSAGLHPIIETLITITVTVHLIIPFIFGKMRFESRFGNPMDCQINIHFAAHSWHCHRSLDIAGVLQTLG